MSSSPSMKRKRVASTIVACPIVYGSIAFYLGKKADQLATHRWTLFVRGPNNEDLSAFIQKVAFTLHPSFAEPVREIKTAPFEVTETGWGEFEAGIRIFFKDPAEQPVDLFQTIKLYPLEGQQSCNVKKPVVSESYDEIIFKNPSEKFYHMLMTYCPTGDQSENTQNTTAVVNTIGSGSGSHKQSSALKMQPAKGGIAAVMQPEHCTIFDDALDLETLTAIHVHIKAEIDAAKAKLALMECQSVMETQQKVTATATQQPPLTSTVATPAVTIATVAAVNINSSDNVQNTIKV